MDISSIFLCVLFLCGALTKGWAGESSGSNGLGQGLAEEPEGWKEEQAGKGLTSSTAHNRLHCYTCSFAKPCYPISTECQDDEVCGITTGTSDQNEIIERKGCLPRAQCILPGHTAYWLRSYTLRHHCCEQDLCNEATLLQQLPSLLLTALLLLVASFAW
ncbi:lymphocyte antigen 6G6e-like [Castor canadensis]